MPPDGAHHLQAPGVELTDVTVRLGGRKVLDSLSLTCGHGEFVTLLAPSGEGKSTVLNAIAGFLAIDEGKVLLQGRDVTTAPVHRRDVGFIFQDFALFPNMSVWDNVAYPLRLRRVGKPELRQRVEAALRTVGLLEMSDRGVHALSGGQRQRVAIARGTVHTPRVLLMDEPMSSLDRALREDMTREIKRVQEELGITAIYVTHDQHEALSLSDRIGILRNGRIVQLATPTTLFDAPSSLYSARLTGAINSLPVVADGSDGKALLAHGHGHRFVVSRPSFEPDVGTRLVLAVRPQNLTISPTGEVPATNALPASVERVSLTGTQVEYLLRVAGGERWRYFAPHPVPAVEPGASLVVSWSADGCLALPEAGPDLPTDPATS